MKHATTAKLPKETSGNVNDPDNPAWTEDMLGEPVLRRNTGNVKSIEKAVASLRPAELAEFRHWFAEFDALAWDQQIKHDANSGDLDALTAEALSDYRSGSAREI